MPTIEVNLPHHRYDVRIEPGGLARLGELTRAVAPHEKAAVIVDETIEYSHGLVAARSLKEEKYDTQIAVMPSGEEHKTLGTFRDLQEVVLNAKLERKSPIVAVGGGVTGDTVGFVAATYLRGVPFIQCPTTLLAMVDASVGGKVGVDVPQGKNLIGAFHQPHLVLIDTDTLKTLPDIELCCGLAECIKHGMIRDAELFEWTREHTDAILAKDSDTLVELVGRNVAIKAAVVMEDEKESGVRSHLNLGHTFAHAIEAVVGYDKIKHGQAVSLGMVAATILAVKRGICDSGVVEVLIETLERIGLPTGMRNLPPSVTLTEAMKLDKKVRGGKIRLILPTRIGEVLITDEAGVGEIVESWDALRTGKA